VDDLVRGVHDELSRQKQLTNTLFVYVGDNGMNRGEHRLGGKSAPYVTNVPFAISWPRLAAGTVTTKLEGVDLAPTLCELAGCTMGPYPNGQQTPDGVSFAQLLLRQDPVNRDAVLEELPQTHDNVPAWWSVVTTTASSLGLWRYTEYETGEKEMYDLSNGPCWKWKTGSAGDPCELENVAGDPRYAAVEDALRQRLAQLKQQKGR
jgi:choline-sulfatase